MNTRLPVYLMALLALFNLAMLISLILDFGHGHVWAAVGKLLALIVLDVLGVWLLRAVREG